MLPRPGVRSPFGRWSCAIAAGAVVLGLQSLPRATGVFARPAGPAGASVKVLRLDDIRRVPRHRLPAIRTYRWAAATALSVVERDLHLPTLHGEIALYASDAAFKASLRDDGYRSSPADSALATMVGVSTPGHIRLNIHQLYPYSWSDRIAALAHEMTHVAQYQLAGGERRRTEQWLREGMAQWVAARVLEVLGQATAASSVGAVRDRLSRALDGPQPDLSAMVSADSWGRLVGEGFERPLYDLSLVAAADLIEHHGLEALIEYFGRFSGSDDRPAHFRACFGEAPETFEARLDRGRR